MLRSSSTLQFLCSYTIQATGEMCTRICTWNASIHISFRTVETQDQTCSTMRKSCSAAKRYYHQPIFDVQEEKFSNNECSQEYHHDPEFPTFPKKNPSNKSTCIPSLQSCPSSIPRSSPGSPLNVLEFSW